MYALPEIKPDEVLLYLRKSRTDDPALSVQETLSRHERMLDDFSLRTWGSLVPERNRFREVVSGETIEARPEVQRVLRLVEQPRFRAVLIVEPQRLSRGDLEDIGRIVKILRYTGTLVITLQGSFDLGDERDRDFFVRELKRGSEYLDYQKRIMGNGRVASVERGNFLGTVAPYGYTRVWVRENKKKAPTLAVNPAEVEAVRLIFRLYADGAGASAICSRLSAEGFQTRSGRPWRPPSVYAILDNPVYVGRVRWGRQREERVVVDGELVKHRALRSDPLTCPGKHPAIVSDALWASVRARRGASGDSPVKRAHELINPLAGLVRCSCGAAMEMRRAEGGKAARLMCRNRGACPSVSCRYPDFLAAFTEALRGSLENLEAVVGGAPPDNSAEVQRLEGRVAALAQKETALWEKYAEGMPRPVFDQLLAKTHTEQAEAAALLEAERSRYADREAMAAEVVTLHAALDLLGDLDRAPVRAAQRLLRACVRRVVYDRAPGGPLRLSVDLAF